VAAFSPKEGAVTAVSVEAGPTFEVFAALQNGNYVGSYRADWTRGEPGTPVALLTSVVGHGHAAYGGLPSKRIDKMFGYRHGPVRWLGDYFEMDTYDSELRLQWTELVKKYEYTSIELLMRSRLVAMGVAVVNLATGGVVKTYTDRAKFEAVVQQYGLPAKRLMPAQLPGAKAMVG